MPKITTGIRNVAAEIGGPASPPPARRAWEKFKRDVQKLPLRLAHALDLGCKVVPSSKGSKQAYLSKLSQDKMDPLATFRGLIDLSESEKHGSFGDGKIDKKQAYRLLKNLKAHGEMITTLQKQIDDMGTSDSLNHHETKLLNFLKRLKGNQEAAAKTLMDRAGYEKEQLQVHVDSESKERLEKLLGNVRQRAKNGDDGNPATLLRTELSRAKDAHRIKNGTAEQRKFGRDLREVRGAFAHEGRIADEPLKRLLKRARFTDSKSSEELIKKLMYRDGDNLQPTVERDTAEQWHLLSPLLQAMSDQLDGEDTAAQDLKIAIENIQQSGNEPEKLHAPDLSGATQRHDVVAAIHDLVRYVKSTLPDNPRQAIFQKAVENELIKQNFTGERLKNFLKHADQVTLNRHSNFVRKIMQEFYKPSLPDAVAAAPSERIGAEAAEPSEWIGAVAAEPSERIGAVAEQIAAVNPTAKSIGETDISIFEGCLMMHFTNTINKAIDGLPYDIEEEVRQRMPSASPSEILQIRDFFIRHAWIPGYFTKGETHVEVLFGAIAQNYSYYANQAVLNGAHYEPEFWTERQEKKIYRFEEILMRCGYEKNGNPDPSFGLKMYAETLDSFGYEPKELFSPFFRYFRDEEKRVMADLLIVKSETDYLEMLVDIADIVRSLEPNASPEEFRFNAYLISPPTMPDYMKQIVSKYPAFTYRHPVARAAREARSRNADPGAVNEAQRKVDDIEMVAEVLRDRAGLNPYSGLVRGVPRRDRNNVMPHNVMPYETKIAEKNGDVRQALWELRREEKDKPPAAPRGRRPPPNRQRVARRPNPRVAPAPMPESLPLTPRSRAELESIIADLEPPQLPNEDSTIGEDPQT